MSAISPPGRQQSLVDGPLGTHEPAYLRRRDPPEPGPDTHIPYWVYITTHENGKSGRDERPTVRDDRVVTDSLTCACGRPAGADGLCYACRADHAGEVAGNGRRL